MQCSICSEELFSWGSGRDTHCAATHKQRHLSWSVAPFCQLDSIPAGARPAGHFLPASSVTFQPPLPLFALSPAVGNFDQPCGAACSPHACPPPPPPPPPLAPLAPPEGEGLRSLEEPPVRPKPVEPPRPYPSTPALSVPREPLAYGSVSRYVPPLSRPTVLPTLPPDWGREDVPPAPPPVPRATLSRSLESGRPAAVLFARYGAPGACRGYEPPTPPDPYGLSALKGRLPPDALGASQAALCRSRLDEREYGSTAPPPDSPARSLSTLEERE